MQVILSEVLGYCMGVRNAVEMAKNALEKYHEKKVYCLGPLIHNKTALDELIKKGLIILKEDEIEKIEKNNVVVIRAHGISPEVQEKIEEKNCIIINATCPRVQASQKIAEKYASNGFAVFFAGDKQHGEVVSIEGYAKDAFKLIENSACIKNSKFTFDFSQKKAILLSQTTFSPLEFEKIADTLSKKIPHLKITNTICPATKERQDALQKLCPKVEAVLVIGGKNSANTKRLLQTAKKNCKNAVLIENASDIPKNYFSLSVVGISSGASTPDEVIEEVVEKLKPPHPLDTRY